MKRICIYPKDISRITGKSYRQSLRIYNNIKKIQNKQSHQLISIEEACQYLGLDAELIRENL
ncbi:hypothetical protein GEO21_22155 [Sphingobacterium faecium]|uniref:hypothetical protein n=1 Tax=Sphingobacterium faecium TaxID=34087 RepID=UPI001292A068|nr:hypothetical protein [Sphingobacterium faecium]MQP30191.1 hypothetical protein [Sphingobacterium faecium]